MDKGIILIASSDEPMSEYLYHQLADFHWTILRATMVSELLRRVRSGEADVVILDSEMEGIPSYDLLPLIKKINARLPVIALSESSSVEVAIRVRQEGIFFQALKPVDPGEIRLAVGDAMKMIYQQRRRKMTKVIVLHPEKELDLSRVHEISAEHKGKKGDLLIVLQKVQAVFNYVPQPAIGVVAQALGATPSEIFGVLTFYNRFHLSPQGKHTVRACRGTACHFKGAPSIIDSIKSHLHLENGKETTDDSLFSLEEVACLGACGIAPVMTLDEDTFGNLTPGLAVEAIARLEAAEREAAAGGAEVPEEKKAA